MTTGQLPKQDTEGVNIAAGIEGARVAESLRGNVGHDSDQGVLGFIRRTTLVLGVAGGSSQLLCTRHLGTDVLGLALGGGNSLEGIIINATRNTLLHDSTGSKVSQHGVSDSVDKDVAAVEVAMVDTLLMESGDGGRDLGGHEELVGPVDLVVLDLEVPGEGAEFGVLRDDAELVESWGVGHSVELDHTLAALHTAVNLNLYVIVVKRKRKENGGGNNICKRRIKKGEGNHCVSMS